MTRANSIRNREGKSAARNRSMAASAERSLADLKLRKSGILVMDSLPLGGAYLCVLRDQRGPARYRYFLFRGRIGKQRILRMGGFRSNLSGGGDELGASRNPGW
jgi:hypothetical protein